MSDYSKDELITLIQKNPQEFNEWIKDKEDVDLSEVDFSNLVLDNINFANADLNSSSFADAQLTEVNFNNCDLTSVDFTRTNQAFSVPLVLT